jgi:hypothetical protein
MRIYMCAAPPPADEHSMAGTAYRYGIVCEVTRAQPREIHMIHMSQRCVVIRYLSIAGLSLKLTPVGATRSTTTPSLLLSHLNCTNRPPASASAFVSSTLKD